MEAENALTIKISCVEMDFWSYLSASELLCLYNVIIKNSIDTEMCSKFRVGIDKFTNILKDYNNQIKKGKISSDRLNKAYKSATKAYGIYYGALGETEKLRLGRFDINVLSHGCLAEVTCSETGLKETSCDHEELKSNVDDAIIKLRKLCKQELKKLSNKKRNSVAKDANSVDVKG